MGIFSRSLPSHLIPIKPVNAGNKDWLVGLRGNSTTSYATIFIWKAPVGGTAAKIITASPSTSLFKGVAVDGNAS